MKKIISTNLIFRVSCFSPESACPKPARLHALSCHCNSGSASQHPGDAGQLRQHEPGGLRSRIHPERIYDGYFKPSAAYSYSAADTFTLATPAAGTEIFSTGSTMRRIDLVRKCGRGKDRNRHPQQQRCQSPGGRRDGDDGYEIIKAYAAGAGLLYPLPEELG